MAIGYHIIAELYNCNQKTLKKVADVEKVLEACVKDSGLTKLSSSYHQFKPFGVTGFILLSESHVSVHTWPENNYVAVDIFTCGPPDKAKKAFSVLKQGFESKKVEKTEQVRG